MVKIIRYITSSRQTDPFVNGGYSAHGYLQSGLRMKAKSPRQLISTCKRQKLLSPGLFAPLLPFSACASLSRLPIPAANGIYDDQPSRRCRERASDTRSSADRLAQRQSAQVQGCIWVTCTRRQRGSGSMEGMRPPVAYGKLVLGKNCKPLQHDTQAPSGTYLGNPARDGPRTLDPPPPARNFAITPVGTMLRPPGVACSMA